MAFGFGYKPMQTLVLADGEYEFIIQRAQEHTTQNGRLYVEVEVQAKGKAGYNPRIMDFFDIPKLGTYKNDNSLVTQEDIDKWNKQMTSFFDCFGIGRGDFNYASWRGHTGICKVVTKKTGYKGIFPKAPEPSAPLPASVQAATNAFNGTAKKVNNSEEFPEDIPF